MALFVGVPISALPPAGTLTGTELFVIDQGSITSQLSLNDISAFIGSGGLSFANGLTSAAGVAKFGGALTGNTLISGAFAMQFIGNTGFDVESDSIILQDVSNNQSISITNNGPRMHSSGMAELSFDVGMQQALFTDSRTKKTGIEYADNYYKGYTPRTLPDTGYVDCATKKIHLVGKPDAFGDSVVAGTGVTASQYSLISLLSTGNGYNGIAFRNLGVGGYGSLLTSIQAFSNQSTFGGLSSCVMMCGINDIFRNGAPSKTVFKIKGAYRSIIVNTFLAFAKSADTLTNTGTWSNFTLIPGKANNLGGNMRQSSTAGDTITYTNTANVRNLVIGTVNTDGTTYNYGRFTVTVDGVLMATFDPNNRTDKVTDGTYDNGITHEALIFDTIWSFLTITLLDNKPTVIDYVGYMKTPERCQGFLAISPCKCTAVGYATPPAMGNDADVDVVIEAINEVVNEFVNRPVAFLDTRKFYDPLTQSNADGIHPKNNGTQALSIGSQYNIYYQDTIVNGTVFDQVAGSDPSYIITDLSKTVDHRKYEYTNTGGNLYISRINDTLTTRMTAFAVADNGRVQINASGPNVTPAFSSTLSVVGIFGVNSFSIRNNADTSTVFNISNGGTVTIADGTQANGYVLTSNSSGVASWQAPSSGAPTLTATQIGFGSGSNLLTGASTMTFDASGVNFGNATRTNQRYLRIGQGTSFVDVGEYTAGSYGAIYFNQSTPNSSNYAFLGNASTTQFNATSTVAFNISDISKVTLTSSLFTLLGVDLQLANAFVPGPPSNLTVGYVTMKDSGGNSVQIVCWK